MAYAERLSRPWGRSCQVALGSEVAGQVCNSQPPSATHDLLRIRSHRHAWAEAAQGPSWRRG
eukprot:4024371-Alexandrium_andersonii.AAC.1